MKSIVLKASLAVLFATGLGINSSVVNAADVLIPVQPTVAVVDNNHAAIVAANGLLNAFLQAHPGASITEISFDGEDGTIKYEVEGFNQDGAYELKYVYNTNQITDERHGDYSSSMARKAFDPVRILPPASAVNFAFAQTQGQATSINKWSVKTENYRAVYKIEFGSANRSDIVVRMDAVTGQLLSVKGLKK